MDLVLLDAKQLEALKESAHLITIIEGTTGHHKLKIRDYDVFATSEQISKLFENLNENLLATTDNYDYLQFIALHWILFHQLHDELMPQITQHFYFDDLRFLKKLNRLNNLHVNSTYFGGNRNYSISFSASVVELSVLDLYKCPVEKMTCLCVTYDLLFAQLKEVIVSAIAKYSEKDNEIPIVNNSEITPMLMIVITKSRLIHLISNMFYIRKFFFKLNENRHALCVYKTFEDAIYNLNTLNDDQLDKIPLQKDELNYDLDPSNFIQMSRNISLDDEHNSFVKEQNEVNFLDEEKRRIVDQITKSTLENCI